MTLFGRIETDFCAFDVEPHSDGVRVGLLFVRAGAKKNVTLLGQGVELPPEALHKNRHTRFLNVTLPFSNKEV